MFDLAVQGYAHFTRYGMGLAIEKVSQDPLSGLVNGLNTRFFTNYHPILTSGSLLVYVGGNLAGGVADYDSGEVTLSSAPTSQPKATYSFAPYTTRQVTYLLMDGFEEMETRWNRDWKLVDANGALATADSVNLYVVDTSGSDPNCGPALFSQSPVQIGFYNLCVRYRMLLAQLDQAAIGDYVFRESRGVVIDKSKRPGNIEAALRALDDRIRDALESAQESYYTDGSQWGGYVGSPASEEYLAVYEWQASAALADQSLSTGYLNPLRGF